MKTVTFTEEEYMRLLDIVACHIDLTLEPQVKKAGANGHTTRVIQLAKTIELEKGIQEKLLNAGGRF